MGQGKEDPRRGGLNHHFILAEDNLSRGLPKIGNLQIRN